MTAICNEVYVNYYSSEFSILKSLRSRSEIRCSEHIIYENFSDVGKSSRSKNNLFVLQLTHSTGGRNKF